MKDFYNAYYSAIESSQAHHSFCERVFGIDLGQHGFADLQQLELLIQVTQLDANSHALDLGCGNGKIAEYLSDRTGARIIGMDYIESAIQLAQARTRTKAERLNFIVGDMNRLELPRNSFNLILSIDTIYFSEDYAKTIRTLKEILEPNGQIALFYSYGREPWVTRDQFPKETLPAGKTPLAQALLANGLEFRTWDLTERDYELARTRKQVLAELESQFKSESNTFIYENRMGDANGITHAIEEGLHARYLYLAQ
jgi:cyclopropane fatty-acyl-phospholipid synthase-like methyltransferase